MSRLESYTRNTLTWDMLPSTHCLRMLLPKILVKRTLLFDLLIRNSLHVCDRNTLKMRYLVKQDKVVYLDATHKLVEGLERDFIFDQYLVVK